MVDPISSLPFTAPLLVAPPCATLIVTVVSCFSSPPPPHRHSERSTPTLFLPTSLLRGGRLAQRDSSASRAFRRMKSLCSWVVFSSPGRPFLVASGILPGSDPFRNLAP